MTEDEVIAAVVLMVGGNYVRERHMERLHNRQLITQALDPFVFGDDAPFHLRAIGHYDELVLKIQHALGGTQA